MCKPLPWILLFAGLFIGIAAGQEDSLFERLDKNKDGYLTSDEAEGDRKPFFERLLRNADVNKDGKLDKLEFAAGLKDVQRPAATPEGRPRGEQPSAANATEFFKRLDRNADGKLQKSELPERMQEAFDRIDANGDGAIDAAEFGRVAERFGGARPDGAAGANARQAEELFARLDANNDGRLTMDEIPEDKRDQFKQIASRARIDIEKGVTKEAFVAAYQGASSEGRPQGGPEARPLFPLGPLFAALDTDHDGELSAEEIANAPQSLAALDKNGDGKISRQELGPPPDRLNPEEMLRRLKEADRNGDGKLSKEESPERLRANFEAIDRNDDGFLDEAELKAAFQRLMPRQP